MKKIICRALTLAILLAALPLTPLAPKALAANGDNGFWYEQFDGSNEVFLSCYDGPLSVIEIPATVDGVDKNGGILPGYFQVAAIGSRAFEKDTYITQVTLPDTIKSINAHAFDSCTELKKIHLGKGLRWIERQAFENCTKLEEIDFPDTLEVIASRAFRNCSALERVDIPDSVTDIEDDSAFENCTSLKDLTLGTGLKTITVGTFQGCTALERVDIPGGVTLIDVGAFGGCTSLTDLTIGDGVEMIGRSADSSSAFRDCTSLVNVKIGSGVKVIGANTFRGCTSLADIQIPDNVTALGSCIFWGCESLSGVSLGSGLTQIGQWSFRGTMFDQSDGPVYVGNWLCDYKGAIPEEVEIRDGTAGIATFAFNDSKTLARLIIPASVKHAALITLGCPNVTVRGYRNTAAHRYAVGGKIPFIPLIPDIDYTAADIIVPGSEDGFEINLTAETIAIPATYTSVAYSTDGGVKWKAAKPDTFSGVKFPKLLNKGMTLVLSDKPIDRVTRKPEDGATVVTFAKIKERPPAPKMVINYAIAADPTGGTPGEWVLTEKNGAAAVKNGMEIGKADAKNKNKTLDASGFGKFYADRGIPVELLENNKVVKNVYYIRIAPRDKDGDGAYTAAGKPKKVSAVSQQKAKNYNVKNGLKFSAGVYVSIDDGPAAFKAKNEAFDILDAFNAGVKIEIWFAATPKKPAGDKQMKWKGDDPA